MRSALVRAQISLRFMSRSAPLSIARDPLPDLEQKQTALSYLSEAWADALAELVSTYGEDAVAKFVEGLSGRVKNGEFSLKLAKQ
jgi:hypothetical protein